jgi:hypothetical protein
MLVSLMPIGYRTFFSSSTRSEVIYLGARISQENLVSGGFPQPGCHRSGDTYVKDGRPFLPVSMGAGGSRWSDKAADAVDLGHFLAGIEASCSAEGFHNR